MERIYKKYKDNPNVSFELFNNMVPHGQDAIEVIKGSDVVNQEEFDKIANIEYSDVGEGNELRLERKDRLTLEELTAQEEAIQDGQLDDCPLTQRDMRLIAGAFCRVLSLGAGQLRPDERSDISLRDAAMRLEAANRHDENRDSTVHPLPSVARHSS